MTYEELMAYIAALPENEHAEYAAYTEQMTAAGMTNEQIAVALTAR